MGVASVRPEVMAAVRRKLNVTWHDEGTDERIADVVEAVSPRLAARLGYDERRELGPESGQAWSLFLNACLYEFSDALDDFWENYRLELDAVRQHNVIDELWGEDA